MSWIIPQGDTGPQTAQLMREGQPIDVTASDVRFVARRVGTSAVVVDLAASKVNAKDGIVSWSPPASLSVGEYEGSFQVFAGDRTTVPTKGLIEFEVVESVKP